MQDRSFFQSGSSNFLPPPHFLTKIRIHSQQILAGLLLMLLPRTDSLATGLFEFSTWGIDNKSSWHTTTTIDSECDGIPVYGSPGVVTPISLLPNPLPSSFKIEGTLRVTSSHVWSNLSVKMGNAAHILIDQTASLSLTNGTVIEGCETMWVGVALNLDATLVVSDDSEINDAVNAIYVTKRCTVTLNESKFKRNFRTLFAVSPTLQNFSFNLYTAGSWVDGAGPLKPPHTGQSFFEHGPKSDSGFRFIRCNSVGGNLKVGDNASLQCVFRNCEYGISSASSFLTVENTRFEEITGSTIFGGYGIYGEYGYYKIQQCEFFHCYTGIYLYKMNFLVDDNDFSTLSQALFAWQSRYYINPVVALPTVKYNRVDNVLNGFVFFQNDDSNPQVYGNTSSKTGRVGILIMDIAGMPNRSYIYDNTLDLSGGGWPNGTPDGNGIGIHITSTRNAAVCRNTISHSADGEQAICISADGSTLATITNNTTSVNGALYLGQHIGIRHSITDNSTLDCNTLTGNTIGLQVNGVSTTTKVSKNTFAADLRDGMVYNMATTQVQTHTGNRWTYFTDASFPGAVNNGSNPAANRFLVDGAENSAFLPHVVSAPGWFVNESTPGNTPLCNPGGNICSVQPPFAPGGGEEEMLGKIINNELTFSDYSEASAWLASRQALSWIAVNGLTNTAPYATYWAQNANTSQGKLAQLEASAILWKASHTTQEQQMGALWGGMLALMEGTDQSEAAQYNFENKRQQLETLREAWDTDFDQLLSTWTTVNATLPEDAVHVFNIKRLNALLLDLRTRNQMTFTTPELSMLEEVAEQCLFSGGQAVLQARTLLSILGSESTWDDVVLCSERGQAATPSQFNELLIAPNPNDGTFQLMIPKGIASEGAQVFVYDMSGRLLHQLNLQSNSARLDLTDKVHPGLYLLEVRNAADGRVGVVKISVQ